MQPQRPTTARQASTARDILAGLECDRPGCECHRAARQGRGVTHCPVSGHGRGQGDRSPSLQVSNGLRAPVWTCHAGCERDAITEEFARRGLYVVPGTTERRAASPVAEVSGPAAGVTVAELAAAKSHDPGFLRSLGLRDVQHADRAAVAIPYRGRDGKVMFERKRVGLTGKRFWQPARVPVAPYGLDRLADARTAGRVLIVEGESDCWACWAAGEPALGLPGKGTWKPEFAAELDGIAEVWVWQEPDAADLVQRVARDLPAVRKIVAPDGVKDLAEAHERSLHIPSFLAGLRSAPPPPAPATPAAEDGASGRKSQATELVELALEQGAELWHDPAGDTWATLTVNGHLEHWRLKSEAVRRWLRGLFYARHQRAPGAQGVQDALGVLDGHAYYQGEEHQVHLRVAELGERIYIDLCDAAWSAIEVEAGSWRVVNPAPVRFRRARGMLALPVPAEDGELAELRRFVNLADDDAWRLLVAWLLAAWRPRGPYPALVLRGEQGSAKSTTGRILRELIDPSVSPLRAEPKEVRDLMIAATNGWCVALDNLSRLPDWLSDALCRLATGGGFSTRELYSDDDEKLFDAMRPALLTGIDDVVTAADLLDRVVTIDLPVIPDGQRRPERELWAEFTAARPRILRGLVGALAGAMAAVPTVRLDRMPRMADFAVYSVAVERSLSWPEGSFLNAYSGNRAAARETTLEDSPIAPLLRDCVAEGGFTGTASDLLAWLNERADEQVQKRSGWPKRPNVLSGYLRRLMPDLRAAGWAGVELRRTERGSQIAIRTVGAVDRQDRQDRQPEFNLDHTPDDPPPSADDPPAPADDLAVAAGRPTEYAADGSDGPDDVGPSRSSRTPYPAGLLCQQPGCRGVGWTWNDERRGWYCAKCGAPTPATAGGPA